MDVPGEMSKVFKSRMLASLKGSNVLHDSVCMPSCPLFSNIVDIPESKPVIVSQAF